MKRSFLWILFSSSFLLVNCGDVTAIEDGKKYGPVIAIQDWFTSCHLLKAGKEIVLFDACWREGTLQAGLEKHGIKPDQVTHVLLTHGHADHVGGLGILKNAKIWALPEEQAVITEHAGSKGQIDRKLKDGELLKFGQFEVKVMGVKGHTAGSAVYLVNGTLILGDSALINSKGLLVPAPEDRSENPALLIKSLIALDQRLKKEKHTIKWLLPAHSAGIAEQTALSDFAKKNK